MVPYVRKSYWKHYKDGIKYFVPSLFGTFQSDIEKLDTAKLPIEPYQHSTVDYNGWMNFHQYYKDHLEDNGRKIEQYALDMTGRELKQAVEAMFHNLNSLQSRSGNQLPFSSINFGTCTLPEGRMVIKALLEGSLNGVGKLHKTPVFPCSIFQLKKGVNREEGDPNYDLFQLALKSTALRLYPNYANCDWSGNEGYDPNDPKTYFSTINRTVA